MLAKEYLNSLKYEVAQELPHFQNLQSPADYQQRLNQFKFEVAQELGIPLSPGYNGDLKSRDAGRIGGKIGGKIGGHMVRRMIQLAEQNLQQNLPR